MTVKNGDHVWVVADFSTKAIVSVGYSNIAGVFASAAEAQLAAADLNSDPEAWAESFQVQQITVGEVRW